MKLHGIISTDISRPISSPFLGSSTDATEQPVPAPHEAKLREQLKYIEAPGHLYGPTNRRGSRSAKGRAFGPRRVFFNFFLQKMNGSRFVEV